MISVALVAYRRVNFLTGVCVCACMHALVFSMIVSFVNAYIYAIAMDKPIQKLLTL